MARAYSEGQNATRFRSWKQEDETGGSGSPTKHFISAEAREDYRSIYIDTEHPQHTYSERRPSTALGPTSPHFGRKLYQLFQPSARIRVHSGTPQHEYRISKPKIEAERKNEKKSNYFLQRIAMQQDCVEEEDKEEEEVYGNVDKDLIRNFIAHQMDLGDTFKRA
ncbi:hypothetical protein C7M61_001288 [Candidozyma pseudohaemuli]|uniref:Uncharacterized protein n=1 Tax=Candidozyma pseudohaemuli TaxID=418784 RepID=A0A2P7Z075_9ASCO|nr:hypothetical protein C7M61_001288 [[Candida] pseudohaemulonii]PSK41602.1 hypothetical protein C7M61_001288 [[Candida] pseudohaemulonii]